METYSYEQQLTWPCPTHAGLENLPQEAQHLLEEIKHLDVKSEGARRWMSPRLRPY